jgi:hypothetical protein
MKKDISITLFIRIDTDLFTSQVNKDATGYKLQDGDIERIKAWVSNGA